MRLKTYPPKKWNPRIEGLRGFSILLVFLHHLMNLGVHNWGALGVSIFFVISGYVITESMTNRISNLSQDKIDLLSFLKSFYTRRGRRLLPLAILVILITQMISLFDPTADNKQYFLSTIFCLLYIGNFFGFTNGYTDLAPALGHFWSLAVEEQFYFAWPIIYYFAFKKIKKVSTFFWLIIVIIVFIQISHPLISLAKISVSTLPTTYSDLLLVGCGISIAGNWIVELQGLKLKLVKVFGILSLVLIILTETFPLFSNASNFQYNWNFLLAVVLFVFATNTNFFDNRVFRFFGKISYSLYCIHYPLIVFSGIFLGDSTLLIFSVAIISIALSTLSYQYFESKFYLAKS